MEDYTFTPTTKERWLTVGDVADRLDLGLSTVYRILKSGKLQASRFGKSYKISESDYLKYRKNALLPR